MEKIHKLVLKGNFVEARTLALQLRTSELEDILVEGAFKHGNITYYSFTCYLLSLNESSELHDIAASIMIQPLCHMEGAYTVGLYHTKRAIELEPLNVSRKELMLLFYLVQERVVTREEAIDYANEILLADPLNKAALGFFELLKS